MKSREMQNFWRHTYDFFADSSKSTTISQLCALFVDEQNCWTRQLNTAVLQLLFLADGLSYPSKQFHCSNHTEDFARITNFKELSNVNGWSSSSLVGFGAPVIWLDNSAYSLTFIYAECFCTRFP